MDKLRLEYNQQVAVRKIPVAVPLGFSILTGLMSGVFLASWLICGDGRAFIFLAIEVFLGVLVDILSQPTLVIANDTVKIDAGNGVSYEICPGAIRDVKDMQTYLHTQLIELKVNRAGMSKKVRPHMVDCLSLNNGGQTVSVFFRVGYMSKEDYEKLLALLNKIAHLNAMANTVDGEDFLWEDKQIPQLYTEACASLKKQGNNSVPENKSNAVEETVEAESSVK